jgi:hypothetical protein
MTFSRPFNDQSRAWRPRTSFGFNDLETLVTEAREATHNLAPSVSSIHDKKRPRCPHCVQGASVRSERLRTQSSVYMH